MKTVIMTAPATDGSTTNVAGIDKPRPGPGQVAIDIAHAASTSSTSWRARAIRATPPPGHTSGPGGRRHHPFGGPAVYTACGPANASRLSPRRWHGRGHDRSSRRDRRSPAGRAARDPSIGATLTRPGLPTSASGPSWAGYHQRIGDNTPTLATQSRFYRLRFNDGKLADCGTSIAVSRCPTLPDRTSRPATTLSSGGTARQSAMRLPDP